MNHYEVLQVRENADSDEIRTAYLRLVRRYHPDRQVGDANGAADRLRFQRIQEAYEVLHDPEQRRDYDLSRHAIPQRRSGRPVVTPAPPRRRDVPTDWIQRRLPRRKKRIRIGRLLFTCVLVLVVATVVPQCGRVLQLNLMPPVQENPSAPVEYVVEIRPELSDSESTSTDSDSRVREIQPTKQAQPLRAATPPRLDRPPQVSRSPAPDQTDAMIGRAPELHTLEWMSRGHERDWRDVVAASADSSSPQNPLQDDEGFQADTNRGRAWTHKPRERSDPVLGFSERPDPTSFNVPTAPVAGPLGRDTHLFERVPRRFQPAHLLQGNAASTLPKRPSSTPFRSARPTPNSLRRPLPYSTPSLGQLGGRSPDRTFDFSRPRPPAPTAPTVSPVAQPAIRSTGILAPRP